MNCPNDLFLLIRMGLSLTMGGLSHAHSHGRRLSDSAGGLQTEHASSRDVESVDVDIGTPIGYSSPSHQDTGNINVRTAFVHVLGDLIHSFSVLIASLVIYFFPEYHVIDPICTLVFSFFVLFTTRDLIGDVLNVLMKGVLKSSLARIWPLRKATNQARFSMTPCEKSNHATTSTSRTFKLNSTRMRCATVNSVRM